MDAGERGSRRDRGSGSSWGWRCRGKGPVHREMPPTESWQRLRPGKQGRFALVCVTGGSGIKGKRQRLKVTVLAAASSAGPTQAFYKLFQNLCR